MSLNPTITQAISILTQSPLAGGSISNAQIRTCFLQSKGILEDFLRRDSGIQYGPCDNDAETYGGGPMGTGIIVKDEYRSSALATADVLAHEGYHAYCFRHGVHMCLANEEYFTHAIEAEFARALEGGFTVSGTRYDLSGLARFTTLRDNLATVLASYRTEQLIDYVITRYSNAELSRTYARNICGTWSGGAANRTLFPLCACFIALTNQPMGVEVRDRQLLVNIAENIDRRRSTDPLRLRPIVPQVVQAARLCDATFPGNHQFNDLIAHLDPTAAQAAPRP